MVLTKRVAAVMVMALGIGGSLRSARADLFGGDVAVLTGILAEAINQGLQLKTQIDNLEAQVKRAKEAADQLNPSSFSDLKSFLAQAKLTYDQLKNDQQQIAFTLQSVNGTFRKVFPPGKDLKNTKASDYDPLFVGWQNEVSTSAQTAMRAQVSISTLDANARAAEQILQQSGNSNRGQVQQLQLLIQMVGVVQNQMNSLLQTMGTTNRVISNMAAASAGEKEMVRERKRRRMENYTRVGQSNRLTRMP